MSGRKGCYREGERGHLVHSEFAGVPRTKPNHGKKVKGRDSCKECKDGSRGQRNESGRSRGDVGTHM